MRTTFLFNWKATVTQTPERIQGSGYLGEGARKPGKPTSFASRPKLSTSPGSTASGGPILGQHTTEARLHWFLRGMTHVVASVAEGRPRFGADVDTSLLSRIVCHKEASYNILRGLALQGNFSKDFRSVWCRGIDSNQQYRKHASKAPQNSNKPETAYLRKYENA